MNLLVLIFGIVLLPKAYTLKCYDCQPGPSGSCTETTIECPLQCGAMRMSTSAGGSIVSDVTMKSCVPAQQCFDLSINFGMARHIISNKCCTTDLCNKQAAPEPSKSSPNGKKCYYCNGQTCTATLNCEGNEDHCISTSVMAGDQKTTVKGCASKLVCSDATAAQMTGAVGADIKCCQGDFCNGPNSPRKATDSKTTDSKTPSKTGNATSMSAGLLLLLAPLVTLVAFS
ncbi:urokinase plasminogen activator surface receptor-like [Scomber japonicus]|uniref:urokinase plasminogen activator surface receptor-like n=1 Tax=Scomber japonicus TaxID=13676 RepID=UPI00230572F3|nr:urokinase plasminogen activator surface receptor-like [Scomber japonicus]